jgi:RNA polymerase sigma-70 factor (ECF subfamily)
MNLEDEFAQYRGELVAHCYRMLGSLHDAEDSVQETYLRAWKGFGAFQGRSSIKTWLYRIATNVCLNALQHSSRRVVPSALGAPGNDPDDLEAQALEISWLEPFPDPALVVGDRQSLRLAMVAALQHLPPRQRAVLILRDVLVWQASEVADLLETTTAAVNSSLQRARAELAKLAPAEDQLSEPDEPVRRALLDQYSMAFERADFVALEGLLTEDTRWEMPPIAESQTFAWRRQAIDGRDGSERPAGVRDVHPRQRRAVPRTLDRGTDVDQGRRLRSTRLPSARPLLSLRSTAEPGRPLIG